MISQNPGRYELPSSAQNEQAENNTRMQPLSHNEGPVLTRGWEGWFRVTTRLVGDREIDIDDRGARLLFSLELNPQLPRYTMLENLHVVLKCSSEGARRNIAIDGMTAGEIVLFDRKEQRVLLTGKSLNRELNVTTGVFSSLKLDAESAEAGLKEFEIEIEYDLARGPDIVTKGLLFFQIAKD